MKTNQLLYQYRISVTISDPYKSLSYLEQILHQGYSDFSFDDIEILNKLSKILLSNSKKTLGTLITYNTESQINEYNKTAVNLYTVASNEKIVQTLKRFLVCTCLISAKLKEHTCLALINKIEGKIHSFLYLYDDNDKSSHLENALEHYKKAVTYAMKLDKYSIIKLRILLSFAKFQIRCMKDYYRSVLFASNVITEIKESENEEVIAMADKFKKLYEDNIDAYNRVLKVYYPEIKKYI